MIGFFVNLMVVRVDLSGAPSFYELLARVREASLGAYHHGELPFDQLVERLRPERQSGRNPLIQVTFQLNEIAPEVPGLEGLQVRPLPVPDRHVRFDLELTLRPDGEGLSGEIGYSTDLFGEPTIERLAESYRTLLDGVAATPETCVNELPILSEAGRYRFLVKANDTAVAYPRNRCIHQLFEDQAARTPEAVAIVCGDRLMTYGQLNWRANQLARRLRALGVAAESRVVVRQRRSPEIIVALLAILKAGGAYVPLNPDDPESRLRLIVKDSGANILLTETILAASCPDLGVTTLLVNDECGALDSDAGTNLEPVARAESLAYVMYTSGTTGEPKGVLIQNRSVVRLVCGTNYATFGQDRVFLHLAPLAFDASTFEIWGALLHGARLVLAPDGLPEFDELGKLIHAHGVTTVWLTAGLFNSIVETLPTTLAGVPEILTGGEALSPKHVRMAYDGLPQPLRIINGYGPTECTTFACCHPVDPAGLDGQSSIPIGTPISNTQTYVLDAHGQPVPTGVAGELYLGGDGLARGYLNKPAATAERFVPDPFDRRPEARLYRTGDLVRWRVDGSLEFLGRLDSQVKLRGFRIELAEIETALGRHPAIRQAAVVLREDRPGEKRLVAYFVAGDDSVAPEDSELRAFLATSLPEYMVPSAFVSLASFPLNANGKLDRKGLPVLEVARAGGSSGHIAPRDEIERALAAVWEDVLGLAPVGIRDGFFQLGGHSLLAIRLVAKIEDALHVRLPLSTVLRADTIEGMARIVKECRRAPSFQVLAPKRKCHSRVVTLQPHGNRPAVFMLPGGIAHVMSFRHLALAIGDEWPLYGLQPNDQDLRFLPHPTFEELAKELVDDMSSVAGSGPYQLLGFSAGGLIAFEMAQQLTKAGKEVRLLGLLDTFAPGYPGRLPLHTRMIPHFHNLCRLNPAEGCRYALDRGRAFLKRFRQPALLSHDRIDKHPGEPLPTKGHVDFAYRDVLSRYRPSMYQGRVEIFTADKPDWIGLDFGDATLGWGALVKGELRLHRIAGDHLEIINPPFVNLLAAEIRKCLG
jgi:amino acid adenylation domain-containing protein